MSRLPALCLLLSVGVACGPPDFSTLDITIDLNPPDFVDGFSNASLCDDDKVYRGDVGPAALPGEHLVGMCGIEGNVRIDSRVEQAEKTSPYLSSIKEVRGDVTIENGASGGVMSALERITGHLDVSGRTAMEKLRHAGSVTFNPTSADAVNGLTGLVEVKGDLLLKGVGGFISVPGLEKLERVGGTLHFEGSNQLIMVALPALVTTDRFVVKNARSLERIVLLQATTMTNLSVMDNPILRSVKLPMLKEIEGASAIVNNPYLQEFEAPKLENAGDLTHCDNGATGTDALVALASQVKRGRVGPCRR